jgi:hypothetical protein
MRSQRGVPLPKRTLVPPPMIHERWFHVEHTPINEPASLLRSTLDESMHLRINGLHR